MERAEKVVFKRSLEPDFARDIVVEKAVHIESVSPFRRSRHTEQDISGTVNNRALAIEIRNQSLSARIAT